MMLMMLIILRILMMLMMLIIISVPVISAEYERVFSQANLIITT